jgi:hypothetical protein
VFVGIGRKGDRETRTVVGDFWETEIRAAAAVD